MARGMVGASRLSRMGLGIRANGRTMSLMVGEYSCKLTVADIKANLKIRCATAMVGSCQAIKRLFTRGSSRTMFKTDSVAK